MTTRHIRTNDEYRGESRHTTGARSSKEPVVEDRRRKEPKTRKIEDPMDVDMDEDSDEYDRRRGGARRAEKYTSSVGRNPTIPATSGRHNRGDRTPPDESGRAIINAIPERDQPRIKPGTDRDFWIPDAGIEREVITYEITRYLGQDALVRPGKNEKGQSGFLITAFRAPTTEMIRSMKEASEKFIREMQSTRSRPAAYSSSRTATGRDKDLGQYSEREPPPSHRRGGYESDDSMDDAPPVGRAGYDRDYDRREREPESRRGDRHGRDPRDDPRQVQDPRYQDPRVQDPRVQDPRSYQQDPRLMQDPRVQDPRVQDPRSYQQDSRLMQDPRMQDSRIQDSRMQDPRMQDQRMMQDPRYQERFPDPRDVPVASGRHQAYTTAYQEPAIPGYTLSPSAQPANFDYSMAQPRGYSNNTPPPTTRGGQPIYVQPGGYPAVNPRAGQIMIDPQTGRQILVPVSAGYAQESQRARHGR